jgi:hypothetical protein
VRKGEGRQGKVRKKENRVVNGSCVKEIKVK